MRLDRNNLQRIYNGGSDGFVYRYYLDPKTKEIYLEYDIIMEAKYLFRYSLKEDKGIWLFTVVKKIDMAYAAGPDINTEVAGRSKQEAVAYMIGKILEKPMKHESARIEIQSLEAVLRVTLR